MKTLGDFRNLIRAQAGGIEVGAASAQYALEWSMVDLVMMSVEAKSDRFRFPDRQDLIAGQAEYRLPAGMVAAAGVAIVSSGNIRSLNNVSFTARAQPAESYFGNGSYDGYTIDHRTVTVMPTPSSFIAGALVIYGWIMPKVPNAQELAVPCPLEAERFLIANAVASHLLPPPPPQAIQIAAAQASGERMKLEKWLRFSVRDVLPGTTYEGGGAP